MALTTMSANLLPEPVSCRRHALTAEASYIEPLVMWRFDGARASGRRLRSLEGVRHRTLMELEEDLRQFRRVAKPLPPVGPKMVIAVEEAIVYMMSVTQGMDQIQVG